MSHQRTWWRTYRPLAVAAAIALLFGIAAAPNAASAEVSSTENRAFKVGHLNILNSMSQARFVHDLNLITSNAHLVGLNEVAGRYTYLQNWADTNGWHLYAPGPYEARNEALLARKSMFDVVSRGSIFVCDTNGPGEVPPARYNNWVRYKHKPTGRYVFHINAHANAHIDNNGHPYDLPRTDCAEKQFRDIKALATDKQSDGQVVVSGDLNVDFVDDRRVQYANFPWRVFEANELPNLRSTYNILGVKGTGTHGDRHIDYIYFWKRVPDHQKMWLTDYSIVGGTESDHNGLLATFAISMP